MIKRLARQSVTHYHIDDSGMSVYKDGVLIARTEMTSDQLIGLAFDAIRASRMKKYPAQGGVKSGGIT